MNKFLDALEKGIADKTFVKATLANYKGDKEQLQKVLLRPITTKKGGRLYVVYRRTSSDITKNYPLTDARKLVRELFADGFASGHLFTTANDHQLEVRPKGTRLTTSRPTFAETAPEAHDREKASMVDASSGYLTALGITDDRGRVRSRSQAKWRQINKFVEVIVSLIDESPLKDRSEVTIVDMGSGKGYLTFALYDHLTTRRGMRLRMTGVEARAELVRSSTAIAEAAGFDGLKFVEGTIADAPLDGMDILIALHACDTATDDALFRGIRANASVIVAAPCCHKELRRQMSSPPILSGMLKHGIMREQAAEMVTDSVRAMLLAAEGYSTKVFEFVSPEHTPKNNMIAAVRSGKNEADGREARELLEAFGIREQRLKKLLETA